MRSQISLSRLKSARSPVLMALLAPLTALMTAPQIALADTQTPPPAGSPREVIELRVRQLNEYGKKVFEGDIQSEVDQRLEQMGYRHDQVAPMSSLYSIAVIGGGECFVEASLPTRTLDNSLARPKNVLALKNQIDAAARFVRELHLATRGSRLGPFSISRIEICSKETIGAKMKMEPSRLLIGINHHLTGVETYNSMDLMKMWNSGEGLSDKRLKKAWIALNPVGPVRSSLRQLLERVAKARGMELTNALQQKVSSQEVASFVRANLNEDALKTHLCQSPSELVMDLADSDSLRLLAAWRARLSNSATLDSLLESAMSVLEQAQVQEENNLKVDMKGLVNVGNYHRIDVTAPISIGRFQRYVKVIPRKMNIDVRTTGFVNVYTIDDIRVASGIQVSLEKAIESVSFEEALRDLGHRPSCGR